MGKRVNTAVWLEKYKRWQIKVQKDGERRTFTSSTPGRTGQRECNAKADAWLDDNISNENRRVNLFFDEYIEDLKSRTSKSNWINEESRGKNWIKPEIGNMKLSSVTSQHLQNIINKGYKSGLSQKSLKNLRATMFGFFKFCRKCKASKFYPEDIVIPKGAPVGVRNIVQPDGIERLFSTNTTTMRGKTVTEDLVYAFRFQVVTGLRPGEVLGLKWADIKEDLVFLRRSINIYGEVTSGKNDNAIRTFVLPTVAKKIIDEQRAYPDDPEYVFPRFKEQTYLKRWKRFCEVNGIPPTTLYELRHTFVSAVQGLPESYIKNLVGHSKNMDTFGVYGHEVTGIKKQIAEDVNKTFEGILKSKN